MIALVDADLVAYRCAASANNDPLEIALIRCDKTLQGISQNLGTDDLKLFLSGSRNFRYDLYPDYKANRRDMVRPIHLQACREYLVNEWNAEVSDGYEADDAIGISWNSQFASDTVICSLDKDLKQLGPANHFNFVTGEHLFVDELTAVNTFYKQLLLGDKSDNVPGFDGRPRAKPTKYIQACYKDLDDMESEQEMFDYVRSVYKSDELLLLCGRLLYILRDQEATLWEFPVAEVESLSSPKTEEEIIPC